jgi:alkylated DNA repair dioxygenase AlkB
MASWHEYYNLPAELRFDNDTIEKVWKMRPPGAHKIRVFGKEYFTPRLQQAYGRDYPFSGTIAQCAGPIPEVFNNLLLHLNKKYSSNFNMLLINWYRDGNDYIGMHSDDEKQMKAETPVVTVSLGTQRDFFLVEKKTKKKQVFKLENNSVFVMGGTCQKTHKHGLPKRKKIRTYRISLTFREFK